MNKPIMTPTTTSTDTAAEVETTIQRLQQTNLLVHPRHLHSFQTISKLSISPLRACMVCHDRLGLFDTSLLPSFNAIFKFQQQHHHINNGTKKRDVVHCLACHQVAHRSCAFSSNIITDDIYDVCPVNYERLKSTLKLKSEATTDDDDNDDGQCRRIVVVPTKSSDDNRMLVNTADSDDDFVWSENGPPGHWAVDVGSIRSAVDSASASTSPSRTTHDDDTHNDDEQEESSLPTVDQDDTHIWSTVSRALLELFRRDEADVKKAGITSNTMYDPDDDVHATSKDMNDGSVECRTSAVTESNNSNIATIATEEVTRTDTDASSTTTTKIKQITITDMAKSTHDIVSAANRRFFYNYKNIGIATVAGAVGGGAVGLAVAGPAGMLVGLRVGSAACRAVVAVETIQFCILIGGAVAGASHAVQQAKEGKVKILTFGGEEKKVALVRPYIIVDPGWDEIVRRAKKQAFWDGMMKNPAAVLALQGAAGKRQRNRGDSDILCAEEDEIESTDKVFLLVSRSVSNRRSLPGFVYRYLLKEFRSRMANAGSSCSSPFKSNKDKDISEGIAGTCSRLRRQDCHAIIHHITLTLIEVRPGLGSSAKITEMTATAVESLVFGELYEYIFEEILQENKEKDEVLIGKINQFEALQRSDTPELSAEALHTLSMIPESVAVVDKMSNCVQFLELLCNFSSNVDRNEADGNKSMNESSRIGADSLLKLVCEHILAAGQIVFNLNTEIGFLTEFARDEYLLRGKEGYTLVTLQAALHFLQSSDFFENF